MKEFLTKLKFEYVFAFAVLIILAAALFIFKDNNDVVNTIITVFVSSISAITAFFFTKTQIENKKEEKQ
ncbi:hypothetical protein [Marinisporobacter balticus]|uniref:Uncharacterized protein n=1 Tax=Marinisporobacter balticus TaxID=2018667 RepID=A0A4R2L0R6_9FIRM|nr:hypothetical protein [Marinisporobacter balticus]TCO79142.1 hypothetical protein EV214_103194 [Marinisporobacter balticus]